MSKGSSQQSQKTVEPGASDELVSNAIQELLDTIRGGPGQGQVEQRVNMERSASDYSAIILRGQVENQRVQMQRSAPTYVQAPTAGLAPAAMDLQRIVHQVRAHFMALADMEVRRMLDDVLLGGAAPPQVQVMQEPAPRPNMNVRYEEEEEEDEPESPPAKASNEDDDAGETDEGNEDLYEGTVKLMVMAGGNMQRVVRFVDELCQRPQFRMLRMAGSPQQQGAEISLGLREPLAFEDIVAKMKNVLRVESNPPSKPGEERTVTVHLTAEAA